MAPTKDEAVRHAKLQLRDAKGHFVKGADIKAKTSISTFNNPEFEKPLVSISVNNPFKKILYWLDHIRKHQTTTFAIKLSIPLIALPIIIAAVFSLGRISGINLQKIQASPQPIATSAAVSISKSGTLKIAKGSTQTRYLLSLKNGATLNLQIPQTIDLTKYANKQVLVTGTYDKNSGILTVTDIAEIELFNTTIIPQPESSSSSTTKP